MLCASDGLFPDELNTWERAVLEAEAGKNGRVAWYRNLARASQDPLGIVYNDADDKRIVRPDFVFFSQQADRLARSTRDLLDIAEKLKEIGAGLRSLAEPWADTTSPAGRMVLTVFAGIAEFERELIHQRTSTGRVAAKVRGVRFGRPPKLTPDQIALGERLVSEGTSVREVAKLLKCHHATLYRALAAAASRMDV